MRCSICGGDSKPVSRALGVCLDCIRDRWDEARPHVERAHEGARRGHGLPAEPPDAEGGVPCRLCSNGCVMGEGDAGYCGLRRNDGGYKSLSTRQEGLAYAYLDPHVTNCCSAWFCPAGTGAGYPDHAHRDGPEHGYLNLSVFHYGCNFDCLFCQNSSHKEFRGLKPVSYDFLARMVSPNPRISCICHFGGSPEPQLPFALNATRKALEVGSGGPLRVCWEWNGCGDGTLVRRAAELSLATGGNIKFDLKARTPELSLALSGVPNGRAYENFEAVAREFYPERRGLPVLAATTLMVPGYVDAEEVASIARFIADLDPSIPYSLLAFHPDYRMADLPYTGVRQAAECWRAAREHLERVNVGNLHVLGVRSMEELASRAGAP